MGGMNNLLDPAILFFVLGIFAGAIRSNLEIPAQVAKFLSLYLLMALGLKGGFALSSNGLNAQALSGIGIAVALAFIVPTLGYLILRSWVSGFNAAAIASAYGSVSAVTFVTALQYLESAGMPAGGHMTVAMVLMESPAIIMAVLLANTLRHRQGMVNSQSPKIGKILHESFTDGAHLLLLGSLVIGWISGESGKVMMKPFSGDLFKGMLAFFLLDMGLLVARNFKQAREASPLLLGYAVIGPVVHAILAFALAWFAGLAPGDAAILMTLAASASYIVVPAVLRYAIPEANPALYFGLSLGLTFPINILIGIPLYAKIASSFL